MGALGKLVAFLIGLLLLPRIATLIWLFAVPFLGLSAAGALALSAGISLLLIVITFLISKAAGVGFLAGAVIDGVIAYTVLTGPTAPLSA